MHDGRLTADEIAARYGQHIVAGSSQLTDRDGRTVEVFPTFLTKRLYGYYNWQTATYTTESR